jgi:uncharacterized protein (DUF885 family)
MTTINAFHPDFVKTHMKEFTASIKVQNKHQMSSQMMAQYTEELRKTNPNVGTIQGISKPLHVNRAPPRIGPRVKERNMTMKEVIDELDAMKKKKLSAKQRIDLAPREFNIYSKAGTANVTPKGKKK